MLILIFLVDGQLHPGSVRRVAWSSTTHILGVLFKECNLTTPKVRCSISPRDPMAWAPSLWAWLRLAFLASGRWKVISNAMFSLPTHNAKDQHQLLSIHQQDSFTALTGNGRLEAAELRCIEKELSMTAKNPSLRLQPSEAIGVWSVSTRISELKADIPPGYSCMDSLL